MIFLRIDLITQGAILSLGSRASMILQSLIIFRALLMKVLYRHNQHLAFFRAVFGPQKALPDERPQPGLSLLYEPLIGNPISCSQSAEERCQRVQRKRSDGAFACHKLLRVHDHLVLLNGTSTPFRSLGARVIFLYCM